jgi:xylulokinase
MIIGIDIGTQSLKVVVTDTSLQLKGEASAAYQPEYPEPGWAEQDPALWEQALAPTIARALDGAGIAASEITALGIGGQLDGCIAVDQNNIPLHPCLIWMDRRAVSETEGMQSADIQTRTGVVLDASHPAAKMRWLQNNIAEPSRIHHFHLPVSYLVEKLTGNAVVDHALASTTMLYALNTRDFDPWLLEQFQISRDHLPAIADAESRAGLLTASGAELTGLPAGISVAVGTGDDFTTPLGAGLIHPGRMACVLGTAEVVGALHDKPLIDETGLLETHAFAGSRYFIENPGWLSGGALTWLCELLKFRDFAELDSLASGVPAGSEGLIFLPALNGTMAPEWIASARGCFYGLTPAHSAGHFARATLEGTAFAMRDVASRLAELGSDINTILLLGGGAKSRLWAQIRADMTGMPVEIPVLTDTAPLGSAILGAVAAGLYADVISAAEGVGQISHVIEPDQNSKPVYDAAYERYRLLFESLRPLY